MNHIKAVVFTRCGFDTGLKNAGKWVEPTILKISHLGQSG